MCLCGGNIEFGDTVCLRSRALAPDAWAPPFIHNIYLLHACLCFYVTLCNPNQFILFFYQSNTSSAAPLYIIPPSAGPASSGALWQTGRSFFMWSAATHFHIPTPLQSPRESWCRKSHLDSKAPCVSITVVRVGEPVSSPQNLPVVL